MLDELPALIGAGYEQVDEENIVRLKCVMVLRPRS